MCALLFTARCQREFARFFFALSKPLFIRDQKASPTARADDDVGVHLFLYNASVTRVWNKAHERAHVCFEVPLLHGRVCVQEPGRRERRPVQQSPNITSAADLVLEPVLPRAGARVFEASAISWKRAVQPGSFLRQRCNVRPGSDKITREFR